MSNAGMSVVVLMVSVKVFKKKQTSDSKLCLNSLRELLNNPKYFFLSYTFLVFLFNILFVFKHICFIFGNFTERFVWLLVSITCVFLLILPVYN